MSSSRDSPHLISPGPNVSQSNSRVTCDVGQVFGYSVSHDAETGAGIARYNSCGDAHHVLWPCNDPLTWRFSVPTPLTPPSTYSYMETSFARRIQRRSLELAYRVFDDPKSDPQSVFRTFRLVPCFKDRKKMKPYFQKLLHANAGQCLELFGLPFYCIGGAGQHSPWRNDAGDPEIPSNLRLPKRILGVARRDTPGYDEESYAEVLDRMGYGGIWLDSREVEGYLKERGIYPQPHSSVISVQRESPTSLHESARSCTPSPSTPSRSRETATSDGPHQEIGNIGGGSSSGGTTQLYFDTNSFLERKDK